ncbi:MAG TPA: GNAT family N-acetyltransferase [Candidatus Limnocylindrales bacterium]|nr:GNAT family N-acetyltransferase [Candidatus Limnocylindrales bacterium]
MEQATPAQPTLTDGAVTLRPWRPTDAQAVYEACQDPEIPRFVPIPQPYSLDDGRWFVTHAAEESATGPSAHFAIVDPVSDHLLGAISRHGPSEPKTHRAMVGYWLSREARGRGVATCAVRLLTDWTFASSGVIRLELYTDVANEPSRRVALRAGFEFEGIRRAWDLGRDGQPVDAAFYVRIRASA